MADDFGAKVSQPGYDALTAADFQMLFSSGWPTLKIGYEGAFSFSSDADTIIYEHNLGYIPAFFVLDNSTGYSQSNPSLNNSITVTDKVVKYAGDIFSTVTKITIYLYIFRNKIEDNFQGDTVSQNIQPTGDITDSFGIKFAKDGKSIDSDDLRDFTLHSGTQTPIIHQVVSEVTKQISSAGQEFWGVTAQHNLGYLPLFFPYVKSGNGYRFTGNFSQALPRVFGDNNMVQITITISTQPKPAATLFVFKDPHSINVPQIVLGL